MISELLANKYTIVFNEQHINPSLKNYMICDFNRDKLLTLKSGYFVGFEYLDIKTGIKYYLAADILEDDPKDFTIGKYFTEKEVVQNLNEECSCFINFYDNRFKLYTKINGQLKENCNLIWLKRKKELLKKPDYENTGLLYILCNVMYNQVKTDILYQIMVSFLSDKLDKIEYFNNISNLFSLRDENNKLVKIKEEKNIQINELNDKSEKIFNDYIRNLKKNIY